MDQKPEYVSLRITPVPGDAVLPLRLAKVLAQVVKLQPSELVNILKTKSIKLNKVLLNRDLKALIAALKKTGFKVSLMPYTHEKPSAGEAAPPKKDVHEGRIATDQPRDRSALPEHADSVAGRSSGEEPDEPSKPVKPTRKGSVTKLAKDAEWKEGDVIEGLYEVLGSAAGGMGRVYFVHHRLWKMMLAIKTPQRHAVQSKAHALRFLREAELWVNLGVHPNIATCYYARVIEGLPRLFIEYVDGGDLETWIEENRLTDLAMITDLMLQFCHGMIHAEEQGMIHRDIKPANCLLTAEGELKITDFGLVKRVEDRSLETDVTETDWNRPAYKDPNVTEMEGGIMGSPWYMAPERFRGKRPDDIISDIYSFGVMLYQTVLGCMPFRFEDDFDLADLVRSHIKVRPIDPRSIRPDLPSSLVDVLMTCLQKKPENRYPSFVELCRALEVVGRELNPGGTVRTIPNLVGLKADSLNNQAVSLLDLGRHYEARNLLEDANSAYTEHLQAVYNLHSLRWAYKELSDEQVISRMESLKIEVRETADYRHLMGLIQLQRGDAAQGMKLLRSACRDEEHYRDRWAEYDEDPAIFVNSLGLVPIQEEMALGGHVKRVARLAFSPDSVRAFSIGEDRAIRMWDLRTGRCLKTVRTFSFVPIAGSVSHDGSLAATAYGEAFKTLDLWDLKLGRGLRKYQGMAVFGVHFSPDSSQMAVYGTGGHVRIWDAGSNEIVWEERDHPAEVMCLTYLEDSRFLVIGGADGTITVRDIHSESPIHRIEAHEGPVTCLGVSAGGELFLSGGDDETVRLWETSSGKELARLTGHRRRIVTVEFLSDDQHILSSSRDGALKIWDAAGRRCYRTIDLGGEEITSATLSRKGKALLVGTARGSVRLWSLDVGWFSRNFLEPAICRPKTFKELEGLHNTFRAAIDDFRTAWRQDDRREALSCFDRISRMPGFSWSREAILIRNLLHSSLERGPLDSTAFLRSFRAHEGPVTGLAPSADNLMLLTSSLDGTVALWDVESGRCVKRLNVGHPVEHVFLLPRLLGLLTWSRDGALRRWDVEGNVTMEVGDLQPPFVLMTERGTISAMSSDGRLVTLGLETGNKSISSASIPGMQYVGFSDDCANVYSLRDGQLVQKWSTTTGRNEGAFRDLGTKITAFLHNPSSDRVTVGMESGDVVIYVSGSGINVSTLRGHLAAVRSLDVLSDNEIIVTGSDDCSVRLWSLEKEESLGVLEGHSTPVKAVKFFPNGSMIASGSTDGVVRLWGLEWNMSGWKG